MIQSDHEISNSSSREDVPEVNSFDIERRWPIRSTRNILPKRYRVDSDQNNEYLVANYTSTSSLPNLVKNFTEELSKVIIPTSVEEAM
jgi:hypothetical protein